MNPGTAPDPVATDLLKGYKWARQPIADDDLSGKPADAIYVTSVASQSPGTITITVTKEDGATDVATTQSLDGPTLIQVRIKRFQVGNIPVANILLLWAN